MSYANIDASSGEVVATVTSDSEHIKELEKRIDELEHELDQTIASDVVLVAKQRAKIQRLDEALAEIANSKAHTTFSSGNDPEQAYHDLRTIAKEARAGE